MMNEVLRYMYGGVGEALSRCDLTGVSEIRIRLGKPLAARFGGVTRLVGAVGFEASAHKAYIPTIADIIGCLDLMSGHSLYAVSAQLKDGYITMPGGHRVGVSGKCVIEGGIIKTIREPSGLCVRVARAVRGAAAEVFKYIYYGANIENTLIISPPGAGKTTILRDISRLLCEHSLSVSIIDERGEIAGGGHLYAGDTADVLESAPKSQGILMAIRSLSPNAIICDEIGEGGDMAAILNAVGAGAAVICSAHGQSFEALKTAPRFAPLFESRAFGRYITLSAANGAGTLESVLDGDLKTIYERK